MIEVQFLNQRADTSVGTVTTHREFYRYPQYYEVAFGYRDVAAEVDFLLQCFRHHRGRDPVSILEIACGVGYHTLELAQRGYPVVALDRQPEMIAYLHNKAQSHGVKMELLVADMCSFELERPVDLALNLLTSFQYLLTNEDIVAHLRTTYRNLTPGGLYILELNHPREYFGGPLLHPIRWTAVQGNLEVEAIWGATDRGLDPMTELVEIEAAYHVREGAEERDLEERGCLRMLLPGELEALVDLAGGFEVEAFYGDFDLAQPLDASERSWRMLVVLGRQENEPTR